jgi:hypothetical protein
MAERAVFEPISEVEQWHVAAYLVAISPDLQKAVAAKRQMESQATPSALIRKPPPRLKASPAPQAAFDLATAKASFESTCNGCHPLSNVDSAPPASETEARALVARMVDNGLSKDEQTLQQIVTYLARTYGGS